jgi:hypothetical protein
MSKEAIIFLLAGWGVILGMSIWSISRLVRCQIQSGKAKKTEKK